MSHRRCQNLTAANQLFCGMDPNTFNFFLFDSFSDSDSKDSIIFQCVATRSDFPPASFSFWGKTFQPAPELLGTQLTDGLG